MIDVQQLRSNLDAIAHRLASRGYELDREGFLALEAERKQIQNETQTLQASRNAFAKKVGQAKAKGEDVAPLLAEANSVNARLSELEKSLEDIQGRVQAFLAV